MLQYFTVAQDQPEVMRPSVLRLCQQRKARLNRARRMQHTYILNLFLELLVRSPGGHGAKPVGVFVHLMVKRRGRHQVARTENLLPRLADDRESPGDAVISKRRHLGPANRSAQAQIGTIRDPIAIEHHSLGPLREGEQKERNVRCA